MRGDSLQVKGRCQRASARRRFFTKKLNKAKETLARALMRQKNLEKGPLETKAEKKII